MTSARRRRCARPCAGTEAHQASKGNGGNRSVKLAARARIDEGLISGDSDTDSDLAPELTDKEVDAKYEEMYGRAAASKAGAKTGAESDTAARIAELQRQLADQQRFADLGRQLAAAAAQPVRKASHAFASRA